MQNLISEGGVFLIVFSLLALILSLGFTPLIIKICDKKNIYDGVDERKIHVGNIPRLGGIAIFTSFILLAIAYSLLNPNFNILKYWQVILAFFVIYITGLVDDLFDLRAKLKFALQIVAALLVATSPFYFHSFLGFHLPSIIGRGAIFVWILVCVNAYNMIDGMDLICSGLCGITILVFGICGYIEGWNLYPLMFILFFSILGFMYWNKPNAKIFLGDSGSTTLGFLLAVIPVLDSTNTTFQFNDLFTCVYIAAIPTIDLCTAIIRRMRDGVPIFSADRAHLHHKLLNIGLQKKQAIFCVLSIQFYITMVLLFSIFVKQEFNILLYGFAYIVVIGLFICLHYINLQVNLYNNGVFDNCSYEYSKKFRARKYFVFVKIPEDDEECTTNYARRIYDFVKRLYFCFLVLFSWMLSSKTGFDDLPLFNGVDIMYSIFYFAGLLIAFSCWFSKKTWVNHFVRCMLISICVVGLYAFIDELHQFYVPNRHADFKDIIFNFIGIMLGSVIAGFFHKRIRKQN